jgi:SWI/SNF-related matrix-associated actin-dependent regulator 1 of chromatin subfamily A
MDEVGGVVVEALDGLGSERAAFESARAGAEFKPDLKVWAAPTLEMAMRIADRMTRAKFRVLMSHKLRGKLVLEANLVRRRVEEAAVRIEKFDALARTKGKYLYPFQKRDILWMSSRKRVVNCNEMGLGKTVEALCAIPEGAAVWVVCPKVAKGVWKREARFWRPDLTPVVLNGMGSFRWPKPGEIVITNYELLPESPGLLPKEIRDAIFVIADEAHKLKNYKSLRNMRFSKIAEQVDSLLLLTGTPLPDRPLDLWAVMNAGRVAREAYGTWKEFIRVFSGVREEIWKKVGGEAKKVAAGWKWGIPLAESGECMKRVLVRHLQKDLRDELPQLTDKTYEVLDVEIDPSVVKSLDAELAEMPELLRATSLKDIPFEKLSKARALLAKLKVKAALEIAEETEEKEDPIIIFSAHRAVIDQIGKRKGWAVVTGDTQNRNDIEEAFQRGEYKGIAATIQAASTALTLTKACRIYFVDRSFTPAENEQAEGRALRIGQTRNVIVTDLVLDHPIDRRVHEILRTKRTIIDASVEEAREEKAITEEEIEALVPKPAPVIATITSGANGRRSDPRKVPRAARTETERRCARVVQEVSGFVDGRSRRLDNIRFRGSDKRLGDSVAAELFAGEGLTEDRWKVVCLYGKRYASLVGEEI